MVKHDQFFFDQAELRCGGRAFWQHDPGVEYVRIGVLVKAGSILDPPRKRGLAHLFEHLSFAGTEEYPDHLCLAKPVEAHGGEFNASTSPDVTLFTIHMPAYEGTTAWHILRQMVFHPRASAARLRKQVADVKTEIASGADEVPPLFARRQMQARLFGAEYVRRIGVLGTPQSLNSIELADIRHFHRQYYYPGNMIFLAAGNLEQFKSSWPEFLEGELRGYPTRPGLTWNDVAMSPRSRPGICTIPIDGISHPIVSINGRLHQAEGPAVANGRRVIFDKIAALIEYILIDAGQSSVLLQELRVKRPLIYNCDSSLNSITPSGCFWSLDTIVKNARDVQRMLDVVRGVMVSPRTFSNEQVERAKLARLGSMALGDISPSDAFDWALGFLGQNQDIITRSDLRRLIENISPVEVHNLVVTDFHPNRWVTMIYQPA